VSIVSTRCLITGASWTVALMSVAVAPAVVARCGVRQPGGL